MTADQAAEGLAALNAMMHGWELFGIDIGHSDLTLESVFPMADRFREATTYALAQRIAPDNAANFNGDEFIRALQAAYMTIEPVQMPTTLVVPPSRRRFWL